MATFSLGNGGFITRDSCGASMAPLVVSTIRMCYKDLDEWKSAYYLYSSRRHAALRRAGYTAANKARRSLGTEPARRKRRFVEPRSPGRHNNRPPTSRRGFELGRRIRALSIKDCRSPIRCMAGGAATQTWSEEHFSWKGLWPDPRQEPSV